MKVDDDGNETDAVAVAGFVSLISHPVDIFSRSYISKQRGDTMDDGDELAELSPISARLPTLKVI